MVAVVPKPSSESRTTRTRVLNLAVAVVRARLQPLALLARDLEVRFRPASSASRLSRTCSALFLRELHRTPVERTSHWMRTRSGVNLQT